MPQEKCKEKRELFILEHQCSKKIKFIKFLLVVVVVVLLLLLLLLLLLERRRTIHRTVVGQRPTGVFLVEPGDETYPVALESPRKKSLETP